MLPSSSEELRITCHVVDICQDPMALENVNQLGLALVVTHYGNLPVDSQLAFEDGVAGQSAHSINSWRELEWRDALPG